MCVSKEQINDVVAAMQGSGPMNIAQIMYACNVIKKTSELLTVLNEMQRRHYITFLTGEMLSYYRQISLNEKLGPCDDCGLVDHHLLGGECPSCRERSTWNDANTSHKTVTTTQHVTGGAQ